MTPQNEAQMNEEFEKLTMTFDQICESQIIEHDQKFVFWEDYKTSFELQQEKIDKLKEENKSLLACLDKYDSMLVRYLDAEDMGAKRSCDAYSIRVINEIRKRHRLNEVKE